MQAAVRLRLRRRWSTGLPEAFLGSDFTTGLIAAFDDVIGSVGATLDDLDAYLDPRYAPDDFVRWVASWLSPAIAARRDAEHLRRAPRGPAPRAGRSRDARRRDRGRPRVHRPGPGGARLRRRVLEQATRRGRSRAGRRRCSRSTCGSPTTSPTRTPCSTSCGSSWTTSGPRTYRLRSGEHPRDGRADRAGTPSSARTCTYSRRAAAAAAGWPSAASASIRCIQRLSWYRSSARA